MENLPWPGYSAARPGDPLALRRGGAAAVRAALCAARTRTLALADDYAAALGPALAVPYAPELNPPLWELGHVGWFQEAWVARNGWRERGARCPPQPPRGPSLLPQADSWYDSSRVPHRRRWQLKLPDAAGTRAYLHGALERTLAVLDALPPDAGDDALYFFRLVGLHEQMHAEAAVYMAHNLGLPLREPGPAALAGRDEELALPARHWTLGYDEAGFAFDNELQGHEVVVGPTGIDAQVVRWEHFLPFVESGGYDDARWWSPPGAAWLAARQGRPPWCLRRGASGWQRREGDGWRPLDPREPAMHLTAHEAEAWCRWAGRRLPTEAEWEAAALTLPGFRWGAVWEWTASPFAPYPGFHPHPYADYSAPWFGTRRVLRGASFATAPELAHPRYRNFFEPHRSDVFAGFRSCAA